MKRFAQCTNCQQWYVRTYTAPVEIYQHDTLFCLTIWCVRCIEEAEKRSQPQSITLDGGGIPPVLTPVATAERPISLSSSKTFQQFVQEHLQFMDRALYDDETVLVPAIQDFMERCRLYQAQLEIPEQCQRLASHLQYWETFLKALSVSPPPHSTSARGEWSEDDDRA